ncbi:MAG: NAD(P)-binding protein [bacterium]|nr:NAD(P)-binding protein [bacterium]
MPIVVRRIERSVRAQPPGVGKKKQSSQLPLYNTKTPPCTDSCPSSEDIRGYLTLIAQADEYGRSQEMATKMAFERLTDKNPLPATMGRVCPHPCESGCNRGQKDSPVSINRVEMAIGDFALGNQLALTKLTEEMSGKNVAVIGAGPAGLSAAYQLARRGHGVTLFDERPEAGGMLRWGIPSYRLPREVLQSEIQRIFDLGVDYKPNTRIGKDISMADLKSKYDAVYVAIGAQTGRKLPLEGMDSENAWAGVEFLLAQNLGKAPEMPERVLVIGGGDVAYDVARTCRRLGAKEVIMVCRETRELMPATEEEIREGAEEGVELHAGFTPKVIQTADGKVTGVQFLQVEMGEKDENGWPIVTELPGTEMTVDCGLMIAAISQAPDYTGIEEAKSENGWTQVQEHGRLEEGGKVWAGGDIIRRLGLVTDAFGDGRKAALEIDAFLRGETLKPEGKPNVVSYKSMKLDFYPEAPRNEITVEAPEKRMNSFEGYLTGFTQEQLLFEASRCMSCGDCFDCDTCWSYCGDGAIKKLPKGGHYSFIWDKCIGCKKCADECPCAMIDMT